MVRTVMRADCPEPGRLAAFAAGDVSESERNEIVQHLAGCDLCAEIVADTAAWADDEAAGQAEGDTLEAPSSQFDRVALRLAAGVAGAVLATAALLFVFRSDSSEALNDALMAENSAKPAVLRIVTEFSKEVLQAVVKGLPQFSGSRSATGPEALGDRLYSFTLGQDRLREALRVEVGGDSEVLDSLPEASKPAYESFGVWLETARLRCDAQTPIDRDRMKAEAELWIEILDSEALDAPLQEFIIQARDGGPLCDTRGAINSLQEKVVAALKNP